MAIDWNAHGGSGAGGSRSVSWQDIIGNAGSSDMLAAPSGWRPKLETYTSVGKTDINFADPSSFTQSLEQQQGLISGFLGGIAPDPLKDVARGLGSVLELPFAAAGAALGAVGSVPGPKTAATTINAWQEFERLPEAEKAQLRAKMTNDPITAQGVLMAWAKDKWAQDVEAGRVNPLMQDFGPTANLGDELLQLLGLITLPSRAVERTAAGELGRVESLVSKVDEIDNPVLKELTERYIRGEITRDQMLDHLTVEGYGYSDNAWANMGLSLLLDPLILAGGVGGLAAMGAKSGVKATAVTFGKSLMASAPDEFRALQMAVAAERGIPAAEVTNDMVLSAARKLPQYAEQIAAAQREQTAFRRVGMSAWQNPVTKPILVAVNRINDPFQFWGRGGGAATVEAYTNQRAVEGAVNAYGLGNMETLYRDIEGVVGKDGLEQFTNGFGVMVKNETRLWQARELADDLIRTSPQSLPKATPGEIVAARFRGRGANIAYQIEGWMERVMPRFYGTGGREGAQVALADARKAAAERLGLMYDRPAAEFEQITKKMNKQQAAAVDAAYFGHTVGDLRGAIDTALKRGDQTVAKTTLIGPRNMTAQRAAVVMKAIKAKDYEAVRSAVRQYEDLYVNFAESTLDDAELAGQIELYIKKVRKDLVKEVTDDSKLAAEVRDWAARNRGLGYVLGVAPDEDAMFRVVRDPKGKIIGANPWVDWVGESAGIYRPGAWGRIRSQLFREVYGDKIVRQAEVRFIEHATKNWPGITPATAQKMFNAIRGVGEDVQVMPRGLSPAQMWDASRKVVTDPELRGRIGPRGVAEAITHAYEGEMWTVGLTQKGTGAFKSAFAAQGNLMGQIAEKVYPLARFSANPWFQLQEFIEPFILATMRGIKPGVRLSDYDKETLRTIDILLKNGKTMKFDQAEFSDLFLWGARATKETFGSATRLGRIGERLFRGANVAEAKQVAYARQVRRALGDEMYLAFERIRPGYWAELEREFGTASRGEIAQKYLTQKSIWANIDGDQAAALANVIKPVDLGAKTPVNLPHLRTALGKSTNKALFDAVRKKSITRAQVFDILSTHGADEAYKARAWQVLSAPSPKEFWDEWGKVFPGGEEAVTASRALVRARADAVGVTEMEYLATHFYDVPRLLDPDGSLPTRTLFQTVEETLGNRGIKVLPADHVRVQNLRDRMAAYLPAPSPDRLAEVRRAIGKAAEDIDPKAPRVAYESETGALHTTGAVTFEDWMRMAEDVLGHEVDVAGHWYPEMASSFLALMDHYGERELRVILGDQYDAILSREHAVAKGGTAVSGGAIREGAAPVEYMKVNDLIPARRENREFYPKAGQGATDLGELTEKIGKEGFDPNQPIVLSYDPTNHRVLVEDGNTRLAAAQRLGLDEVPVVVVSKGPQEKVRAGGMRVSGEPIPLPKGKEVTPSQIGLAARRQGPEWTADEAVRQEAGARLLAAWALSQMNTSPKDGFGNILHLLDESARGKRPPVLKPAKGITVGQRKAAKAEIERLAAERDWDALDAIDQAGGVMVNGVLVPAGYKGGALADAALRRVLGGGKALDEGVAAKLYDFIDSIRLASSRTLTSQWGDTRLPAAGDIWAVRDRGFVDDTTVVSMAKRNGWSLVRGADGVSEAERKLGYLMRSEFKEETEKGGKKLSGKAYKEAVARTGLQPTFDTVTDGMYESTTRFYNDLAKYLNEQGFRGRTDWTPADAQAVGWVRVQKAMGRVSDNPDAIVADNSRNAAWEFAPGSETLHSELFPWDPLTPEMRRYMTDQWESFIVPYAEEMTGVRVMRTVRTRGGWAGSLNENIVNEMLGTDNQIRDALDFIGHASQQNGMVAAKSTAASASNASNNLFWAYDFVPSKLLDDEDVDDLIEIINAHVPLAQQQGSMAYVRQDGTVGVRVMLTDPRKVVMKEGEFLADWPEDFVADLQSVLGDAGYDLDVNHLVVNSFYHENNWKEMPNGAGYLASLRSRGRGDVADQLERRVAAEARAFLDTAYTSDGPELRALYEQHRAAAYSGGRTYYQRAPAGLKGAASFNAERRAAVRATQIADRTTGTHELAHVFETDLDESMRSFIIGERNKAVGKTDTMWTRETSEWFADEMNKWLGSGTAPSTGLANAFRYFGRWLKRIIGDKVDEASPEMQTFFKEFFSKPEIDKAVGFDLEQEAMWQAGVESLRAAENEAYRVQYFRRGRSWLERSVNHPYFGYYPASYYWGKIMPEMIRFLALTPFGLEAPGYGMYVANRVWRSVMWQKETDPELRKQMEKNPDWLRSLAMLIPATPWDIPVNAPLWVRRIAQTDLQNQQREALGRKPVGIDVAQITSDVATYAFGPAATIRQVGVLSGNIQGVTEAALGGAVDTLDDVFAGNPQPAAPPSRLDVGQFATP